MARHLWFEGRVEEALQRLRGLDGKPVRELRTAIGARANAREVLRQAEEEHRRMGRVASWCELAIAQLGAGHISIAESTAREIAQQCPQSGLVWHTLASVLNELGRFRDAVAPARRALELAGNPTVDRASLALILSRIGTDGEEESSRLATEAIEARDARIVLANGVFDELLGLSAQTRVAEGS